LMLMKELRIADAKNNNKELTQDDIKKIEQSVENEINSKSQSNTSDAKSNSSSGQSDKGNSNKGKSDNGNNGNGNGKSKK